MSDTRTDEEYYGDGVDELYRPFLIHPSVHMILTEQILTLMPKQRNVILSMNSYEIRSLNPLHPDTQDTPTHVTIFCIRLIASEIFQPIGALLTYKYHNQCAMMGECLKAYINDLWKLGLHVVATVSPPFRVFKDIISHVVKIEDIDGYSDVITYDVGIVRNIIHIYDIKYLFIRFQMVLRNYNLHFIEATGNEKKEFEALWTDISTVLGLYRQFRVLNEMLNDPGEISRKVHAFTEPLLDCYLEAQSRGQLSSKAEGSAILLRHLRSFLTMFESDLVETSKTDYEDSWNDFTDILKTVQLKPIIEICARERKFDLPPKENPSIRRKIDFSDGSGGTRKNDKESRENKNSKKSKNKNNKKKKHADKKTEPKRMCQIPKNERSQSLAKIQEMCASLKDDRPYKDVIESQVFERGNDIPSGSFHTTDIPGIPNQEYEFDKECDTVRNYNSDESANDSNNKENIDINSTSDYKIICLPNKIFHLKSNETDDSNNGSCDRIPDIKKSTVDKIENKNIINESCQLPDMKRSPEVEFEIKNSIIEKCEILDIKKSPEDSVGKYDIEEICEMSDTKKSPKDNVKIKNSIEESCEIPDVKKSPKINVEIGNIMDERCEMPAMKKSPNIDVEIKKLSNESCEMPVMKNSPEDDVEVKNNINEICNKIADMKTSPGENVGNKNSIKESCDKPDIKRSTEVNVENKNSINESCDRIPDVKTPPDDNGGDKYSLDKRSDKTPGIKKPPVDVDNENKLPVLPKDPVFNEMRSMILGMKKLLKLLPSRRVRRIKPAAFTVEHTEYFAKMIREKNMLPSIRYYGQNFDFLNSTLAFATLNNDRGLYLLIP